MQRSRRCRCAEQGIEHVELFGDGDQLRKFQNYPARMAAAMAKYVVLSSDNETLTDALTLEEAGGYLERIENKDLLKHLRERFDVVTIRAIAKLHEQFGHPAARTLAASLKGMNAEEDWVSCATLYQCEECLERQRPFAVKVVALPRASYFNEVVETDIFQNLWRGKKRLTMPMWDEDSRFEVGAVIRRERARRPRYSSEIGSNGQDP